MENEKSALDRLCAAVRRGDRSAETARRLAEIIRSARDYRWVGIYEVSATEISAVGWTGAEAPAYPGFPISQGLCGAAVQSRSPVVVGDVRNDPRYLTTFGSTRSETVVPIFSAAGEVAGFIDVESERPDAFQDEDVRFLQSCASTIRATFE